MRLLAGPAGIDGAGLSIPYPSRKGPGLSVISAQPGLFDIFLFYLEAAL